MANHRLVYSTGGGDHRRAEVPGPTDVAAPRGDGIVRVSRETSGRKGRIVTLVRGLDGDLDAWARELKRLCGSGGAVKSGMIELQGDHRDKVAERLRAAGHRVKLAGG